MDLYSSNSLPNPKQLKSLASNKTFSKGNTLLHQYVLYNSDTNTLESENNLHAVLLNMSDDAVNVVNDEGYTALHLAVLKNNLRTVKMLLSYLPNIDVNKICGKQENISADLHKAYQSGNFFAVDKLLNKKSDGSTAFCFAARSGNLELIRLLVSKGAKVNGMDGYTFPLHYAAQSGNLETVKFLLNHGAYLKAIDRENRTILHIAAQSGHLAIVEYLVNQGAYVNCEDKKSDTPLTYAVISGNLEVVKYLVNKRAYLEGDYGLRLLSVAAQYGHLDIIKFFLYRIRNVNINDLLLNAVHLETLEFLIVERGAGVNTKGGDSKDTPLHRAIKKSSNLAVVEFLVSRGADLNAKDKDEKRPLHIAACRGNVKMAAVLLEQGADLQATDKEGRTPLHDAFYGNNPKYAKWLISKGAHSNAGDKDGKTPLHSDVSGNNLICAELLLRKGANLFARDKNGKALLHDAVSGNNLECAEFLIRKNADFCAARDKNGKTPLYDAVSRNNLECADLLLSKGADLCARDNNGITPLHDAVCENNLECTELLLNKGAELHAINNHGKTPLHGAVVYGSTECTKILIERGADINARDASNGFTPLHHLLHCYNVDCFRLDYRAMINLLLRGNADVNIKDENGETPASLAMRLNIGFLLNVF